ncbi:MAG TPA: hypothetical protein VF069_28070, partial [Streptosporangiaceae bacterium]
MGRPVPGPDVVQPDRARLRADLGRVRSRLDTLTYLPRQDTAADFSFEPFITEGNITAYRVSVSVDGTAFRAVARGSWAGDHTLKRVRFRPATAR